jgi:hypothetical protein
MAIKKVYEVHIDNRLDDGSCSYLKVEEKPGVITSIVMSLVNDDPFGRPPDNFSIDLEQEEFSQLVQTVNELMGWGD